MESVCYNQTKGEMEIMSELFEIVMILSFGGSWPMNVYKSYRARTTKGKSLGFLCFYARNYRLDKASNK